MEFESTVVLIIGLIFVSLVSYKVFVTWTRSEKERHQLVHNQVMDEKYKKQEEQLQHLTKQVWNWSHRYRTLKREYDIEPDEDEYFEDDEDGKPEDKVSDLVKIIYPKLPKSVAKIIDKPELQEAVARTASKNPDGLASLIERFTKKTPPAEADPTPKYKETYL